jgi:hypothetical protein
MKLFDRFDKVYCINLDKRPDRMEKFNNEVSKYDLGDFERVSAIDGEKLDISQFNTRLSRGELGLLMTNLNIIKTAKKNNYESILILEDDCCFTDEIKNIDEYFKYLPSDWDFLYMGGNHNSHMNVNPPIIINDKVCKLHSTYTTHFVGIKNTIFDQIESILEKKNQPLDVLYTTLQKIFNAYCFYPAIATQIVDFSNIQNTITDYTWLIK